MARLVAVAGAGSAALSTAQRDAGAFLPPPDTDTKALRTAAKDKAQYQQYPGGDHQHNGRCGTVSVIFLVVQHQNVATVIVVVVVVVAANAHIHIVTAAVAVNTLQVW